jgi:hypothetical protein
VVLFDAYEPGDFYDELFLQQLADLKQRQQAAQKPCSSWGLPSTSTATTKAPSGFFPSM